MAQTIGRMLKKIVDRLPRSAAESGPGARMMAAPEFGSCVGGQGEPTLFGGGLSAMVRQAKERISMKLKRARQRSATAKKLGLLFLCAKRTHSAKDLQGDRPEGLDKHQLGRWTIAQGISGCLRLLGVAGSTSPIYMSPLIELTGAARKARPTLVHLRTAPLALTCWWSERSGREHLTLLGSDAETISGSDGKRAERHVERLLAAVSDGSIKLV